MFIGFTGFIIIIHFIKLKVLTKYPVIETEIEGFLRICLRIQPEYDLRLVDLQQSFGVRFRPEEPDILPVEPFIPINSYP